MYKSEGDKLIRVKEYKGKEGYLTAKSDSSYDQIIEKSKKLTIDDILQIEDESLYDMAVIFIQTNDLSEKIALKIADNIAKLIPSHLRCPHFITWLFILHSNGFISIEFIRNCISDHFNLFDTSTKRYVCKKIVNIAPKYDYSLIEVIPIRDFFLLATYDEIDRFLSILECLKHENSEVFDTIITELSESDIQDDINDRICAEELDRDINYVLDNFFEQIRDEITNNFESILDRIIILLRLSSSGT